MNKVTKSVPIETDLIYPNPNPNPDILVYDRLIKSFQFNTTEMYHNSILMDHTFCSFSQIDGNH